MSEKACKFITRLTFPSRKYVLFKILPIPLTSKYTHFGFDWNGSYSIFNMDRCLKREDLYLIE